MEEKKFDLSSRTVELPDGSEFTFAWDIETYPVKRDELERNGLYGGAFRSCVDDIVALSKMIGDWGGLKSSSLTTLVGMLWNLHRRLDCLLHAFTVTATMHDTEESGLELAAQAIAQIRARDYEIREFGRSDEDDDNPMGALGALLSGLGLMGE